MFDDRLQGIIMQEMLNEFGTDVRTDEGSLAYNACAKIAEKLEEIYGDMDEINSNIIPSTQDDIHLIQYGEERGISYGYATQPIVKGIFQQEIESGERFVCGDYIYEVLDVIEGFQYRMLCDTEGVEANTNLGEVQPVDYIDNFLGGEITEILVSGTEDEEVEVYRQRVIQSFQSTSFGGNRADYRKFVDQIKGVGGCKPKRRSADSPWIQIIVISNEYLVPSQELIRDIQTKVDPEQNSGEGDGMAPICHNVQILPVEGVDIFVETTITFDSGYGKDTSQSFVESAVDSYLKETRESWESMEFDNSILRISQIESRILQVKGVIDVTGTTINKSADNFLLDYGKIPLFGGVLVNV